MAEEHKTQAAQIPGAVPIEIQGIPCVFVDVPDTGLPVEFAFTKLGELAPFRRGTIVRGGAFLALPPPIADTIRKAYAGAIAKAQAEEQARASGAKG